MANEKKLISLDEAIARIKDDGILGSGYSDDERMDDVIDMLESCHIVDAVEVVHGRWQWLGPYRYIDDGVIGTCSVCKERVRLFATNYCPYCGAKMDGGNP